MTTSDGYTPAMEDPAAANAAFERILADEKKVTPPTIALPEDGHITLPGGLVVDEETHQDAVVTELTGEAEEAVARAQASGNPGRVFDAIIEHGVESIGGRRPSSEELRGLLMGDRDALLNAIRSVTYGWDIEYQNVTCPGCGEPLEVSIDIREIPVKALESPRLFEVPLRKGGVAHVRLATGDEQIAVLDQSEKTVAEQNTTLLARVVTHIIDAQGDADPVAGTRGPVLRLSVVDRRKILEEVHKRQPGPQYHEVTFKHSECGKESPILIGMGDLFPGM